MSQDSEFAYYRMKQNQQKERLKKAQEESSEEEKEDEEQLKKLKLQLSEEEKQQESRMQLLRKKMKESTIISIKQFKVRQKDGASYLISRHLQDDFQKIDPQFKRIITSYLLKNQTLHVENEESRLINLMNLDLLQFICQLSKQFNYATEVITIAEGGEAKVSILKVKGLFDLILKQVLPSIMSETNINSMLGESQLMQKLNNDKYIVQVKEEIILFDSKRNQISQVIIIQEKAIGNLSDFVQIWIKPKSIKFYDRFSHQKLFFIFIQACQAIEYLHSNNIFYGDIKAANFLIFDNFQVKLGDFGTAIVFTPEPEEQDVSGYILRGYPTPDKNEQMYSFYESKDPRTPNELKKYDLFRLGKTFSKIRQQL